MRILIALDTTEKGEAVLAPAQKLAQAAGAELVLLNALNPLVDTAHVTAPSAQEARKLVEQERSEYLEAKAATITGLPVSSKVEVLRHGEDVPGCIARVAKEQGADIIVVASKRASGVTGLILGSVVQSLLRISPCPVLVVRPD